MHRRRSFQNVRLWQQSMGLALLTTLLVGSLLVLTSCGNADNTNAGDKTSTAIPTSTSTPQVTGDKTPVPNRDLASIHMINATTGWAFTRPHLYAKGSYVLHTTDGGMHWKDVTPKYATAQQSDEGISTEFLTASIAWVATTRHALFHTIDGGQTWQKTAVGPADEASQASQITFINPSDGWILFSTSDTGGQGDSIDIFRTTDGGMTWTHVSSTGTSAFPDTAPGHLPLGGTKWGLSFLDTSTGWATYQYTGTNNPIQFYVTHDGGSTWTQQTLPQPFPSKPFATLPPTFFSAQDGVLPVLLFNSQNEEGIDLYVTHNGGASWSSTAFLSTSLYLSAGLNATISTIEFIDMNHGWIVNDQGKLLYATNDGGQHWTAISPGTNFESGFCISFVSSALGWALDRSANSSSPLIKTEDGGHTWKPVIFVVS